MNQLSLSSINIKENSSLKREEIFSIINSANISILGLENKNFDILNINMPTSFDSILEFVKITSKLSPIIGNFIEFEMANNLNKIKNYEGLGKWQRQDPGFPDVIFKNSIDLSLGFEVKSWYPFSTEMTARFKESQNSLIDKNIYVVILTWLPNRLIYGVPKIINVCIIPALEIAQSRDDYNYNPPEYIVVEPNDTSKRTKNLQQTNTHGYTFQGSESDLLKAKKIVQEWDQKYKKYSHLDEWQDKINYLKSNFKYREDTNFGKIDRLGNINIDNFNEKVLNLNFGGLSLKEWHKLIKSKNDSEILNNILNIKSL